MSLNLSEKIIFPYYILATLYVYLYLMNLRFVIEHNDCSPELIFYKERLFFTVIPLFNECI